MFLSHCPQCDQPGLVGSGRIISIERTEEGDHLVWYRCPADHVAVENLTPRGLAPTPAGPIGVHR